ncbi:mitochondrial thiamine pyrophosphate transporter [Dissophora ornata]|nr:mitochondrial thiamine pyrophosphate transporter [Dissophora ornata]
MANQQSNVIQVSHSQNELSTQSNNNRSTMSNDTSHDHSSSNKRTSIAAGTPTLSKTETVLCGATSGVVSRFVIAPLDVVKIRMQMQTQRKDLSTILKRKAATAGPESSSSTAANAAKLQQPKYRGMFSSMATIAREEGIRGLWKGNLAAEYLYLTYSGIQFLVYQQTKVLLNKTAETATQKAVATAAAITGSGTIVPTTGLAVVAAPLSIVATLTKASAVQSFIAGANAGIVATASTYPFDLLRTRFAVQRDIKASRHIYQLDGIRGFYRGMSPALIQVVPYMGIVFGSYDTLKSLAAWLKYKANIESSYSKPTITTGSSLPSSQPENEKRKKRKVGKFFLGIEDLMCGALSGIISKTGVYPLDMVRKRLQIQGSEQQKMSMKIYSEKLPNSVWRCIVHIVRMEGYLALYKGLLPGLVKAAPSSAVTFLVFSQAGAFVEKYRR